MTTPLDRAHAAMQKGGPTERLGFYERLADAELKLLLEQPANGDRIAPRVFPLEDGPVILVFDTEARLAEFDDGVDYADLSGRALMAMMRGKGLGLGVNLGVAPSSFLMLSSAVDWLADALGDGPEEAVARPDRIAPPTGISEVVIRALDAKLPGAAGLARHAWLSAVTYVDGRTGHMLAFTDPAPGAEAALARAIREALVFSGLEAGDLDVAFFAGSDPFVARLAKVALRFDVPEPDRIGAASNPGRTPETPPRLR